MTETDAPDSQQLRLLLSKLLARKSDLNSGSIHVVGVDELRCTSGERWPVLAGNVAKHMRQMMRRLVAPPDLAVPLDETIWLIIFSNDGPETALATIGEMQTEMKRLFVGHPDLHGLGVIGHTASFPTLAEKDPHLPERLEAMIARLDSEAAAAATVANNTFRDQDANHKSAVSQLSDPTDFDWSIIPHNRVRYIKLLRKVPTLLRCWLFLQVTRVPFAYLSVPRRAT